jgi:hypothetical protein|tara:strand:+ start:67 stop:348 length:282 start_codon:yes stop_codon:yes gene_type:complete
MAKKLSPDDKVKLVEDKYNSSYDSELNEFKTDYTGKDRTRYKRTYPYISGESAAGPDLMNIHKKFGGKMTNAAQVTINRNRGKDARKKPKYSK